jgi:5-methyltetrahydrofolate--homocysteine methyltransferase
VTDVNDRAHDTDLLDTLSQRVMVGDGAMGTQLQAADLTLDDFAACADAVETKYVRLQSG